MERNIVLLCIIVFPDPRSDDKSSSDLVVFISPRRKSPSTYPGICHYFPFRTPTYRGNCIFIGGFLLVRDFKPSYYSE